MVKPTMRTTNMLVPIIGTDEDVANVSGFSTTTLKRRISDVEKHGDGAAYPGIVPGTTERSRRWNMDIVLESLGLSEAAWKTRYGIDWTLIRARKRRARRRAR